MIPVMLILFSYGRVSSFLSHSTLARGKPSVIQDSLRVWPSEYVMLCGNKYDISGSTSKHKICISKCDILEFPGIKSKELIKSQ